MVVVLYNICTATTKTMDEEARKIIEKLRFNLNEYIELVNDFDRISTEELGMPIVVMSEGFREKQINALAALDEASEFLAKQH